MTSCHGEQNLDSLAEAKNVGVEPVFKTIMRALGELCDARTMC